MNQDLYEALQEAALRKSGGLSVLSRKSESVEDRKSFDHLVLALHKLRELGFVKFRDQGQLIRDTARGGLSYLKIACEFTYDGEKALSYGSYDAYQKSLPVARPLALNVDQSFNNYGSMNGSNIAVHSNQVNQTMTENSQVDRLCKEIVETLRQDMSLSASKRQELIDDVETLKKELGKSNPRQGILSEVYSVLGNTASLIGILPQLQALIGRFVL